LQAKDHGTDARDEVFRALRAELRHTPLWLLIHHGLLGHRNVSLTGRLPDMLHCDLWRTGFASPHRQKNTLLDYEHDTDAGRITAALGGR